MPKKSKEVQAESANGSRSRVKKTSARKVSNKIVRPRKKKPATAVAKGNPVLPTDEQVRLRAYFIAEQRAQKSIEGDHNSDWLEARRQLFEEADLPLSSP